MGNFQVNPAKGKFEIRSIRVSSDPEGNSMAYEDWNYHVRFG